MHTKFPTFPCGNIDKNVSGVGVKSPIFDKFFVLHERVMFGPLMKRQNFKIPEDNNRFVVCYF